VEHDEVHAPRQRDEDGDGDMTAGHARSIGARTGKSEWTF
jgi:hypothetical protein